MVRHSRCVNGPMAKNRTHVFFHLHISSHFWFYVWPKNSPLHGLKSCTVTATEVRRRRKAGGVYNGSVVDRWTGGQVDRWTLWTGCECVNMTADWELDNAVCCDPSPDSSVSPPVTAAPADPLEVCNVYINNIHNTILLLKVSSIEACLDTVPAPPGCQAAKLQCWCLITMFTQTRCPGRHCSWPLHCRC